MLPSNARSLSLDLLATVAFIYCMILQIHQLLNCSFSFWFYLRLQNPQISTYNAHVKQLLNLSNALLKDSCQPAESVGHATLRKVDGGHKKQTDLVH